jgi:tetratricopeptide (TPR) repeat protein
MAKAKAATVAAGPTSGKPFESCAAELVDESLHPLAQLEALEEKVKDLEALNDLDAVIECKIKSLALHRLLVYLHDFPIHPLIRAEIALADAYVAGGFFKQAQEHITRAKEVTQTQVYDDAQCQRLQVDISIADGYFRMEVGQTDLAEETLKEAGRLGREVFGELDLRSARIHEMLGSIAQKKREYSKALDFLSTAWEIRENQLGRENEKTIKLWIQMAEVHHLAGENEDAISLQSTAVKALETVNSFPSLLVEAQMRLSQWLDEAKNPHEALETMQSAEKTVMENLGMDDSKAVEVKREVALLHLKIGDQETALQYLNEVHYLEKKLYGSQSTHVARTLKALGTVHLSRRNYNDAQHCLQQALQIFESDPASSQVVRDIHAKLNQIASAYHR